VQTRRSTDVQECGLTFKNRASYIYRTGIPLTSRCCILYIFLTNISTEYFKHAVNTPFFSSKCRLFHNATFFWFLYYSRFTYRVGVLKFKCKTLVPKVKFPTDKGNMSSTSGPLVW
jgi:hypothetical protein